ncbi:MAG: hypothetical protein M3N49_14580 [Candidatus Eremiobacteraeota bacterium]|nr:hypothetical protein [Candidatus Eremiobacteraeota bacterium]
MQPDIPLDPGLTFRKADAGDRPFVERVYFATHRHIIEALFGWRGEDVERRKFAESYDEENSAVIVVDGSDGASAPGSSASSFAKRRPHACRCD